MNSSSLSKKAGYLIFGRILEFVTTLFIPVITARCLSISDFGLWRQFQLVWGTCLPFLTMGIAEGIYYFYAREHEDRDIYVWQSFFLLSFNGLLAAILILVFKSKLLSLVNNPLLGSYFLILSLTVLLYLSSLVFERIAISADKVKFLTKAIFILALAKLLFIGGVAIVWRQTSFVIYAFAAWVIFRYLFSLFFLLKNYPISFRIFKLSALFKSLKYSLPLGLAVIPSVISSNAHKFIVSHYYNTAIFAIYSIGAMIELPLLSYISDSVYNVLKPKFSSLHKEDKINEMCAIFSSAVRKISFLFMPIFILALIFSKDIIVVLYSKNYVDATNIFRIFLLLLFIAIFDFGVFIRAFAHTQYIFKVSIFISILNVGLAYIAARYLNIFYVAVFFVSCQFLFTTAALIKSKILVKKPINMIIPFKHLAKLLIVLIIIGSLTLFIRTRIFVINEFINLVFYSILFASIYIVAVFKTRLVTDGEQEMIFRKMQAIIRRYLPKKVS